MKKYWFNISLLEHVFNRREIRKMRTNKEIRNGSNLPQLYWVVTSNTDVVYIPYTFAINCRANAAIASGMKDVSKITLEVW